MSNHTESESRDLHALRRAGEAAAIVRDITKLQPLRPAYLAGRFCSWCGAFTDLDQEPRHAKTCVYKRAVEWLEAREGGRDEQ